MRKTGWLLSTALLSFCLLSLAHAQGYAPRSDKWQFALAPSGWLPGMSGDVRVRGSSSRISLSSTDILDEVEFAGQLHIEAKKGDWAFIAAPTIVMAEDDSGSTEAEVEYFLTDLLVAYRFSPKWEVLGGLRRVSMDNEVTSGGTRVSQSESWTDVVAGARYTASLSQRWSFVGHLDASGFDLGSGSDLTWNAAATFFYEFGRSNNAFLAGYRILDIDFDTDGGRFKFDVRQDGPFFGVALRWPRR